MQKYHGSFQPSAKNDILTEALGTPEHGGRLRAASSLSTPTMYQGKRNTVSMEEHNAVCSKVSQMEKILDGILQWQALVAQTNPNIPKFDIKAQMGDRGVNISSSSSINLNVIPSAPKDHAPEDPSIVDEDPHDFEGSVEKQKSTHIPPRNDTIDSFGPLSGFSVVNIILLFYIILRTLLM